MASDQQGRSLSTSLVLLEKSQAQSQASHLEAKANRDQQDADELNELVNTLGLRKPKHLITALPTTIACVLGGAVAGIGALVALPIVGAREQGSKGFAIGCGKGLGAALALPIAGAIGGAVQLLRGVVQTPAAIIGTMKGKQWDTETRSWRFYSLVEEESRLASQDEVYKEKEAEQKAARAEARRARAKEERERRLQRKRAKEGKKASTVVDGEDQGIPPLEKDNVDESSNSEVPKEAKKKSIWKRKKKKIPVSLSDAESDSDDSVAGIADTGFYDLLGVDVDASSSEIKRSYLRLARELHPDKNPDDPQAKEHFQRLGEAYSVLSNDVSRAKYDASGKEGLEEMTQQLDPSLLYELIFGSEGFENLIGELQLASMFTMAGEQEATDATESVKFGSLSHKQRMREVTCAKELVTLLQPYVEASDVGGTFHESIAAKAADLATTPFGEILLHLIGRVYLSKSAAILESPLGMFAESMRNRAHQVSTHATAAKSAVRMIGTVRKVSKLEDKQGGMEQLSSSSVEILVEGAWHWCVLDVESTLRSVCKKVLTDTSVSRQVRRRRAEALRVVGRIFVSTNSPANQVDGKKVNFREQLREFVVNMMPPPRSDATEMGRGDGAEEEEEEAVNMEEGGKAASVEEAEEQIDERRIAEPHEADDLRSMPVRQLKALAASRELETMHCIEKEDYVQLLMNEQLSGS